MPRLRQTVLEERAERLEQMSVFATGVSDPDPGDDDGDSLEKIERDLLRELSGLTERMAKREELVISKEEDRYRWMRETAEQFRAGGVTEIDLDAVADYFDEVSNSDRREVVSRLRRIIEHRLKLDHVSGPELERNRRGWEKTIREQLMQIGDVFDESPSLRKILTPELLTKSYMAVRNDVAEIYEVDPPAGCPYTYAQLLESGK